MGEPEISEPILALAARIGDGESIDWTAAAANAAGEERALIDALQWLSSLWERPRLAAERELDVVGWGRFTLRGQLGRGGSSEVYRAWDPVLEREVALKLYRLDSPRSRAAALNEARLLARLSHPGIVTVYGADVQVDRVGIWMELVEGLTLGERVRDHGPLSAREAALVGLELCRALAAVHSQGCVHGDVKPDNVMRRSGGQILLMDFDIALREGRPAEGRGTPACCAPEVLSGGRPTTSADVYSFGALLFYLASGHFPAAADPTDDPGDAATPGRRDALRLRDLRPELPFSFVSLVERCLAPLPERRPASAAAIETELGTLLESARTAADRRRFGTIAVVSGLVALVTAVMVGTLVGGRRTPSGTAAPRRPVRLVVGAAVNESKNPVFDAAVDSALGLALDRMPGVVTLAAGQRREAQRRMGVETRSLNRAQLRELCLREGYQAALEAEVERRQAGYELLLRAVDCRSGETTAVHRQVMPAPEHLLGAVGSAAFAVVHRLAPGEPPPEPALAQVTTASWEALQLFSRALEHQEAGELRQSEALLRAALVADPSFASAHARLASALRGLGDFAAAVQESEAAFNLRHRASERERLRIELSFHIDRQQYEEALETGRRLAVLYPHDGEADRQLSLLYERLGQLPEAVAAARRAATADPRPVNRGLLALTIAESGEGREALDLLSAARAEGGDHEYYLWAESQAWFALGDLRAARRSLEKLVRSSEGLSAVGQTLLGTVEVIGGDLAAARVELEEGIGRDDRSGQDYWACRRRLGAAQLAAIAGEPADARRLLAPLAELPPLPVHLRTLRRAVELAIETGAREQAARWTEQLEALAARYPSNMAEGSAALARTAIAATREGDLRSGLATSLRAWDDAEALLWAARLWRARGRCDVATPLLRQVANRRGELFRNGLAADPLILDRELRDCAGDASVPPAALRR